MAKETEGRPAKSGEVREPDQVMVCNVCNYRWNPYKKWNSRLTCPPCGSGDIGGIPLGEGGR